MVTEGQGVQIRPWGAWEAGGEGGATHGVRL